MMYRDYRKSPFYWIGAVLGLMYEIVCRSLYEGFDDYHG